MAYKFTEKTNSIQQQTAYVLYMMIGSYFNKSVCSNKLLETSLSLHYQELPVKRQEKLECRVIQDVERELKKVLPVLAKMNCKVFIRHRDESYFLQFETGFETVSAVVDRKGNYQVQVLGEEADAGLVFA